MPHLPILAETTDGFWRPGIGDPSFMGWFTVAAYLAAAVLCWLAYKAARPIEHPVHQRAARLWMILAIAFALLAVNKQLDLQSLFTAIGRWFAKRGGWYEERHAVQAVFVAVLAAAGGACIGWLIWVTRSGWHVYGLAVAGATFIAFFVVIRAASFHHVDVLLGWKLLGVRMNWVLELGGIACVAISAARNLHPAADPPAVRRRPAEARPARAQTSSAEQRESFKWMAQRVHGRPPKS